MNVEERLEQLERELGKQKRRNTGLLVAVAALVIIMVFGFVLMGPLGGAQAESEGQVVAREIVLVDNNGNARVRLGAGMNQPGLAVLGPDGAVMAILSAHSDGSFLALNNARGRTRMILSVNAKGAGVNIMDDNETVRAAMAYMSGAPWPDLALYDDRQKEIWSALQ